MPLPSDVRMELAAVSKGWHIADAQRTAIVDRLMKLLQTKLTVRDRTRIVRCILSMDRLAIERQRLAPEVPPHLRFIPPNESDDEPDPIAMRLRAEYLLSQARDAELGLTSMSRETHSKSADYMGYIMDALPDSRRAEIEAKYGNGKG